MAGYGKQDVLHGVSLDVHRGEVVSVLGHNGAGKTTLLRTLLGMIGKRGGTIRFFGDNIEDLDYVDRVRRGMTLTPAEAPIFRELTAMHNLDLGAFTVDDKEKRKKALKGTIDRFPILSDKLQQVAGTMSGGEQRVLSLGMALVAQPRLMLLDEPSLGIAPVLVESIFQDIGALAANEGLTVLMVEQNVKAALKITDRAYFMRQGSIILEESGERALERDSWWDLF